LVLYVLESMPMPWIFPSRASSQGGGSGGGGGAGGGGGGGGGVGHFSKTDARPWDHEWMGLSELASSVAAADGPAQPALPAAAPPPPPSSLPHEKPKRMSKKKQVAAAAAPPPPPPPAPLSSPAHLIVPTF